LSGELAAFIDAYELLVSIGEIHKNRIIRNQRKELMEALELLKSTKENNRTIHIAGMGRSRIAGTIIGEMLKNLGYRVSVMGETLAKPVKKDDVVLAVSASGWTTTTCIMVEGAIRLGARIIALTATPKSKLDRLADITLYLPGRGIPEDMPYEVRQIMGRHKTPLTPMGTVPETTSILIGIGLAQALTSTDPVKEFDKAITKTLDNARKSLKEILKTRDNLVKIINTLSSGVKKQDPQVFLVGAGICKLVGLMTAIRFQHLALNVLGLDDWKFRKKEDILIAISGSGESVIPLVYAKEAKETGVKIYAITANKESKLAQMAETAIILLDTAAREEYLKLKIRDEKPTFIPAFEYTALITLESTVAQIAENHGIPEEEMRSLHANVE